MMEPVPDASPLLRLSQPVRSWVNEQGWARLRPIQVQALDPVLAGGTDVIISAATASGKTEAAFLPALSRVKPGARGTSILYISPLKALINDQRRRLAGLAARVGLSVTPWSGDLSREARQDYLASPDGILLTTPESLESFVSRMPDFCRTAFADLEYVIIDEFHSLADNERGVQLLSLLHRLETMLHRRVPRIALSATFGDPASMAARLRPHAGDWPCRVVSAEGARRARFEVRTYNDVPPYMRRYVPEDGLKQLIADLYSLLAGGHHLVFTNSRRRAEQMAAELAGRCRAEKRPNEFFPHHGSLSRELRGRLEQRLQGNEPATAVCTMTLELGIDIGNMDSIAQLDAPSSVASLRQRLGRAGRRGDEQVLRLFLLEGRLTRHSSLADRLRLGLFQTMAVLRLLEEGWCEPPLPQRPQYSTLVQQTLSMLAQYDGARPSQLWHALCAEGPFPVDQEHYLALLKGLAGRGMLARSETGQVQLTEQGLSLTSGRDFTTAFSQSPDYALRAGERVLGSLPMTVPLEKGEQILFAGQAWRVAGVDAESRVIQLEPGSGGQAPRFAGAGAMVHDEVRHVMLDIYRGGRVAGSCSYAARRMLREGRAAFADLRLERTPILVSKDTIMLLPWRGDRFCRTLTALLRGRGLDARDMAGVVEVQDTSWAAFGGIVRAIVKQGRPRVLGPAARTQEQVRDKFADLVPPDLLAEDAMLRFYELDAAFAWLEELAVDGMAGKVGFC